MRKTFENGGSSRWEREAEEDQGKDSLGNWRKKFKKKKDQERWQKIRNSRSAKDYQRWTMEERPEYLEWKDKKRMQMMARFRCCNEWRGERYWKIENEKLCRICGWKNETWQHLKEECTNRN